MPSHPAVFTSFLSTLQKIAASKHRLAVPKARSGRRSLSVSTLLRKDKEGTLYKKAEAEFKLQGHLKFQGLPIAIENAKGSTRSGVDPDGKKWSTTFKYPYGYIKNTEGNDGEEIDAYVGPDKTAPNAFVIHQRKLVGGGFDEDKVMLGFKSEDEARTAYLDHYNKVGPKLLGSVSTIAIDELRRRLEEKRKHTKLAMAAFADLDEKPERYKPGDVPSREGTNPGAAGIAKEEDGRGNVNTLPTNGALASSDTGATTRL